MTELLKVIVTAVKVAHLAAGIKLDEVDARIDAKLRKRRREKKV
jgi:hypothetical protein